MDTKEKPISGKKWMLTRRRALGFFMSFFLFTLLTGQTNLFTAEKGVSSNIPEYIRPSGERLIRGKAIYNYYCSPCHGLEGNGLGPNAVNLSSRPRNFTDTLYMNTKSDRDLYQVLKGGGSAVGLSFLMPPWGETLSEQELFDLIVYIRELERLVPSD